MSISTFHRFRLPAHNLAVLTESVSRYLWESELYDWRIMMSPPVPPTPEQIARAALVRGCYSVYHQALRDGTLVRGECAVCGTMDRIHGHHDDYSYPLRVVWLCYRHHAKHHARERW